MEATVSNLVMFLRIPSNIIHSEEEDPEEYPFPLTLRNKKANGPSSPAEYAVTNGNGTA